MLCDKPLVSVFDWQKKGCKIMKIVYITPIYLPHIGGIEIYVQNLALYFKRLNHEITIITADRVTPEVEQYEEKGIKIIRIPVHSFAGILVPKKKKDLRLINREISTADIVHSNDCKFLYRYLAKKKKNYRLILSSHGFIFHTNNHSFLKRIFFKNTVVRNQKYYDKIICVSEQDSEIAKKYGLENITTILPGVDIHKYEHLECKIKNPTPHFLYWGRIARNKGIAECLKKLAIIPDFVFQIIGNCEDSSYMSELENIINSNKLNDKVIFLGTKTDNEIREYISHCDFIMMPSLYEGFGITLVECLSSGKNIIANTNTSYKKILKDADAEEFLFDFENPKTSLFQKISELNSKTIVPKNLKLFSLETMFRKISAVYQIV